MHKSIGFDGHKELVAWWLVIIPSAPKVETPYHDNDLILTPIISPQSG